jgi:type I restriction enzyme M protein
MEKKPKRCTDYVRNRVFAIDFDERCVRVARCLNLIAGDGQTNVLHLNTLDWGRWDEKLSNEQWRETYNAGWQALRKLRGKGARNGDYREFRCDVLMANPPFAGDIKQGDILTLYELGQKADGKQENSVGRDLLFVERNLDFFRPGGRMAVVLPQGRFNNASDKRLREYIAERCRILAVVGLHPNTFKPHTGTKTSVLFVQKWNDDPKAGPLCPRQDDYNIFFATQQKPAKDTSGDPIYLKENIVRYPEPHYQSGELEWRTYREQDFLDKYGSFEDATLYEVESDDGEKKTMTVRELRADHETYDDVRHLREVRIPLRSQRLLEDEHGHFVVDHDLYNHDGLTADGIAEAFSEFAKKEGLSFWAPAVP